MGNLFDMLIELFEGLGEKRESDGRSNRNDESHRHSHDAERKYDKRRKNRERDFEFFGD